MTPILSIIIPAYNASNYIERSLYAIISEIQKDNLSKDEVEIIVVDDCSTDNTLSILEEMKKDVVTNLVILQHDINRQQGAARNTGLRVASGTYVWFVDVDDYINNSILAYCKSSYLKEYPDILQFHAKSREINGEESIEPYINKVIGPIDGKSFLEYEYRSNFTNRIKASWSKWFKREFLIDNNLYFQEDVYWEDVVHTLKSIYFAKSIIYIPVIGYIYMQTPDSDMRSCQSGRKYADTIRFCADSCKFLNEQNASSLIISLFSTYYNKVLREYRAKLNTLDSKGINDFCEILKTIDITPIPICLKTEEHNWLMDQSSIISNWKAKK